MEESGSSGVRRPEGRVARLLAFAIVTTGGGLLLFLGGCGNPASQTAGVPASGIERAVQLQPHAPGTVHEFRPSRLEAIIEIDMGEFFFGNPQGERNPIFRMPAGRTVGLHLHNEGSIVHELMIGRGTPADGGHGYLEMLTEMVPVDLFFYYGQPRAEVEDAHFGELEADAGLRDIWIRLNVPEQLKGEWELGCFIEGHYEAGMKATLIVE